MDSSVKFSKKYLKAIERHLRIEWNSNNEPICVIDRINQKAITALKSELDALFNNELATRSALEAACNFSRSHILTAGFGIASDFDKFVKLGLLYGDRVLLWDVIGSKILGDGTWDTNKANLVSQIAGDLLLLRSVVEAGGCIILPHPTLWSEAASNIDQELRQNGTFTPKDIGLCMALAAIDEGIHLFPYTQLTDNAPSIRDGISEDLYTSDDYILNSAATSLLADHRFTYLEEVSIDKFFKVLSQHEDLRREFRKVFLSPLQGLRPQQANIEIEGAKKDLSKIIDARNLALREYAFDGANATLSFSLATYTAVAAPGSLTILATSALAVNLWTVLTKWIKKPQARTLVHAFREIQTQTQEARRLKSIHTTERRKLITPDIEEFMALPWTEDRHKYLQKLPSSVASGLLKQLNDADLFNIVNLRRFQEDYIGDYLEFVSETDMIEYWRHIEAMFSSSKGILVYDGVSHVRIMTAVDMPDSVWLALLNSLLKAHRDLLTSGKEWYELALLKQIFNFQTMRSSQRIRKSELVKGWLEQQNSTDRNILEDFIDKYPEEW